MFTMIVATACQTVDIPEPTRVRVAIGVHLTLPTRPGYADQRTLIQVVDGTYGDRRQAFQSVVSLSRDLVSVVITLPSGPRVLTIDWSAKGIEISRTQHAPDGLQASNILADLMILLWDADSVNAALDGEAIAVDTGRQRTVSQGGRIVVSVDRDGVAAGRGHSTLVNYDFGYRLDIQTVPATDA